MEISPAPSRRPRSRVAADAVTAAPEATSAVVDVLIYYTSRLVSLRPLADIINIANTAVEESNLAYERSGISHRIRLVGIEETTYDESLVVPGDNAWNAARLRMVRELRRNGVRGVEASLGKALEAGVTR